MDHAPYTGQTSEQTEEAKELPETERGIAAAFVFVVLLSGVQIGIFFCHAASPM